VLDAFDLGVQKDRHTESKLVKTVTIICQKASSTGSGDLDECSVSIIFSLCYKPQEPRELIFLAKSVEDLINDASPVRWGRILLRLRL
jgi:hypothetical protein